MNDALTKANVTFDHTRLKSLIEAYRCNLRNILMNVHLLEAPVEEVETVRCEKLMVDANHFEILRKLFREDTELKDLQYIADNTIVPLMMYENFPKEIFANRYKMPTVQLFDIFEQIMDGMLDAEIHESCMFQRMDWDMYDSTNILKMGYINCLLKQCRRKKSTMHDAIAFTPILTKLSMKQNFGKKLIAAKSDKGIYETENMFRAMDELVRLGVTAEHSGELSEAVAAVFYAYASEVHGANKTEIAKVKRKRNTMKKKIAATS
jgi:hypothetical protein